METQKSTNVTVQALVRFRQKGHGRYAKDRPLYVGFFTMQNVLASPPPPPTLQCSRAQLAWREWMGKTGSLGYG